MPSSDATADLPPARSAIASAIVAASREHQRLTPLLLRRPELRPRQAYVIFWWADEESRRLILQRLAVSREVLQDAASDIFALAAEDRSFLSPELRANLDRVLEKDQ